MQDCYNGHIAKGERAGAQLRIQQDKLGGIAEMQGEGVSGWKMTKRGQQNRQFLAELT